MLKHLRKFNNKSDVFGEKIPSPVIAYYADEDKVNFLNPSENELVRKKHYTVIDDNGQIAFSPVVRMVDLGLPSGMLWADRNIGAESETDYGLYFQWGDTVGYEGDEAKAHSSWSTAPFNGGNDDFNQDYFNGVKDSACPNGVLAPEYDAATSAYGDRYRMPTTDEIVELTQNTDYEITVIGGIQGVKFTSIADDSKYIFIPFAGNYWDGDFNNEGNNGYLWSSSLYEGLDDYAYNLYADSDGNYYGCDDGRRGSFPIRAVMPPKCEMLDLGLPSGTLWSKTNLGAKCETDYGLYYQWGDTVGYTGDDAKAHSTWSTAPFNGGSSSFNQSYFNTVKNDVCPNGVLSPKYDAATQMLGADYSMPTSAEMWELIENTVQEVTEIDGVQGMKFISKVDASKYIFTPFAGYYEDGEFFDEGYNSHLRSCTLYEDNDSAAYCLGTNVGENYNVGRGGHNRGWSIRPIKHTYEYVDLNLPSGLKWAKCNIGATKETDYGRYFQWGDTVGYEGDEAMAHSTWSTAPFNGGNSEFNQAYFDSVKDTVCPNGVLAFKYDAARQHMGGKWRMPTYKNVLELVRHTRHEVTEIEGVNGMKLISKVDSSKYIFIPFAGRYWGGGFSDGGGSGYLWGSSLCAGDDDSAYYLWTDSGGSCDDGGSYRVYSFPVRGVLE